MPRDDNQKPWVTVKPGGVMLRPAEVIARVGLSRSQIYAMIADGCFPPFVKISMRASVMPETWLDAFIMQRVEETCVSAATRNEGPQE